MKRFAKNILLFIAVFFVSTLIVNALTSGCDSYDDMCALGKLAQSAAVAALIVFLYKKIKKRYL